MRPVKYSVNDEFGIYIEERVPSSWAIICAGFVLSAGGDLDFEPSPSNRTEDFLKNHRFESPEEALRVFEKYRSKIKINGRSL